MLGVFNGKEEPASTVHHTTALAKRPMEFVHIDTAGPFPASLGGSRYVVMFVDSASRLQRPYGNRDKSASDILVVVKRSIAYMGVPRAFRSDNGAEYTNHSFVEYSNNLGIRRELTAPYTPQQNGPVESALWRAFKAGHAARLEVSNIYPDIHLNEVAGSTDAATTSLWMESLLWASERFNRLATTANDGWLSPHEIFHGNRPPLPLLPFFQPAYHRVPRQRKSDPRAHLCYFLNFSYNHGHDCHKLLDVETGKVVFSRDVAWHHPEAPLIPPATAVGNPPTAPPGDIYVPMPTPMPSVAAPTPAPVQPAPTPAPSPTLVPAPAPTPAPPTSLPPVLMSNSPAPIPRALAVNRRMRDTWRCPGGRVARPVQCAMHHGNTPVAMVCHRTMRPWCKCWTRVKRYTRSYTNTAPLRTCRPRVHQTCTLQRTFLRWRRHRTRIYGDTQ